MHSQKSKADYVLFILIVIIAIFGVIMMTSVSVNQSLRVTADNGSIFSTCDDAGVDCLYFLKKHIQYLGLGFVSLFICAKIPYLFWKKLSVVLFGFSLLALLAVLVIGTDNNTFARSWIAIGSFTFQPIEFAKLGLVFYLAYWLDQKGELIKSFQNGFIPYGIMTSTVLIPVILQPDWGGALVIGLIALTMLFTAGARFRHLFLTAALGLCILVAANSFYGVFSARMDAYLKGYECAEKECTHPLQANIAVGSGGFWGKGLTQGVQKSGWLPQATDDFIFASISEEMGFLRMFLILLIYGGIIYRGYKIALGSNTRFGTFTALGITTWVGVQAFVNIAVNLTLIPTTGITLPLLSYGGTSLIATLVSLGILLNISKSSSYDAPSPLWRGNRRSYSSQRGSYSRVPKSF